MLFKTKNDRRMTPKINTEEKFLLIFAYTVVLLHFLQYSNAEYHQEFMKQKQHYYIIIIYLF